MLYLIRLGGNYGRDLQLPLNRGGFEALIKETFPLVEETASIRIICSHAASDKDDKLFNANISDTASAMFMAGFDDVVKRTAVCRRAVMRKDVAASLSAEPEDDSARDTVKKQILEEHDEKSKSLEELVTESTRIERSG